MFGDSVMDVQRAMNGDGPPAAGPPRVSPGVRTAAAFGIEPDRTAFALGAMVAGALLALALFRYAGFRFSFGANIGGGS